MRPRKNRYIGLRQASGVQLKYFLRYNRLPAGMNDGRSEVIQRVLDYVEAGKLTTEAVDRAIVEFLEYRNKRVYLYRADPDALARLDGSSFPNLIESWSDARIEALPETPRQNYAWVDSPPHPDHLQRNPSPSRHPDGRGAGGMAARGQGHRARCEPGIGVRHAELRSTRPHPSSRAPPARLLHPLPRAVRGIARHAAGSVSSSPGAARARVGRPGSASAGPGLDPRRAGRHRLDGSRRARDDCIQGGRAQYRRARLGPVRLASGESAGRGGSHLLREIPTDIYASTSMVRFTRDSLVQEVRYVLAQIQAHA